VRQVSEKGPGRRVGVKVYYLKPLCVEVGDQLIFTTVEELSSTINEIRDEVFSAYRRIYYLSSVTVTVAPPIMLCDPAFVAEMPGSKGVLLKIGHFDEVNGVTHVEI
jgi:hypothetical protein